MSDLNNGIHRILTSDIRFTKPSVVNDQVWMLAVEPGRPISLSTTYGLRARRMLVFPEFQLNNLTISNTDQFAKLPQLAFRSTNFAEINYSPFSSIDAQLKVWVPSSNNITGQIIVSNTSDATKVLHIDWLVQLDPLTGGQPMIAEQMGMNTVLHGKSGDLFPVFYLTGGPGESQSIYPGLTIKMLLIPGSTRQVTWVLSSATSLESSFQQARHHSSLQMDVEQFKIEMTDKRQRLFFTEPEGSLANSLNESQNRAYQLVMPAVQNFKNPTYVQGRNLDTGNDLKEEALEFHQEWNGQTLTDTWLMAQNLLPGRPETIKSFIQNILDAEQGIGWIDYRVSANRRHTGHLAPPKLASLVCELHSWHEDPGWLEQVYPQLLQFFRCWFSDATNCHHEFTHPIQTGLQDLMFFSEDHLIQLWKKLKTSNNPLLLSLLYHECNCLIQIAHWLKTDQDHAWLENNLTQLAQEAALLWNDGIGLYEYKDMTSGLTSKGKILCEFRQEGKHKPDRKITASGRLYIQLNLSQKISPDFCCTLSGMNGTDAIEVSINPQSFEWIGRTGVYVTTEMFTLLDSVEVRGWQKGVIGQVGQANLSQADITCFLPLWAGIPSSQQAEKMLDSTNIDAFLGDNGIRFYPIGKGADHERIPNFLAAMIIEGILHYNRADLADRLFRRQFDPAARPGSISSTEKSIIAQDLGHLIPVKLFLEITGVRKLSPREIITTHFNANPHSVTVQYNQTKMILKQNQTEIIPGSGNSIVIDKPGPHRIVFD